MDKAEARSVLAAEVEALRKVSYEDFRARFGRVVKRERRLWGTVDRVEGAEETITREVGGASGTTYQIENLVVWDSDEGGDIRVIVSIDDGGLRAFYPMSDDFIIAPDGTFVGE